MTKRDYVQQSSSVHLFSLPVMMRHSMKITLYSLVNEQPGAKRLNEQVCVQLCRYADTVRICPPYESHDAAAAIDRYFLSAGPSAANLRHRVCCCGSMLRQNGRADTVPLHRPCSTHYAGTANNLVKAMKAAFNNLLYVKTDVSVCE